MIAYAPWLLAIVFAAFIVISRLITNDQLVKTGRIPVRVSLLYMTGFIGIVVMVVWAVVSIGWWGPIPIILLYLATGLVHSFATQIYSRASFLTAAQQAADEFKDMPPGEEKLQKVQKRMEEILGIRKE